MRATSAALLAEASPHRAAISVAAAASEQSCGGCPATQSWRGPRSRRDVAGIEAPVRPPGAALGASVRILLKRPRPRPRPTARATGLPMTTRVDEIADRIYCISTFIAEIGPNGFGFNQILVDADEPLLFHCGMRALFPLVREALARVLPPERLRWVSFSHVEADECGAMNAWLAVAPRATVAQGEVGCAVSLNDLADRPPRALRNGDVLDLGGRSVRLLATPQVPHNWEAIVLFEERTRTLLSGDLLASDGEGPAVTREDVSDRVLTAERMFRAHSLAPDTRATLERLAALEPRVLASMHGRAFEGDCAAVLRRIGAGLDELASEIARGGERGGMLESGAAGAPPAVHSLQ